MNAITEKSPIRLMILVGAGLFTLLFGRISTAQEIGSIDIGEIDWCWIDPSFCPPPPPPPPPPYYPPAPPTTHYFSTTDVTQFVENSKSNGQLLSRMLGDKVQETLDAEGWKLEEGSLIWRTAIEDQMLVDKGCKFSAQLKNQYLTATLNGNSSFDVKLQALAEPIVATINLYGSVGLDGRVTAKAGVKVFGKCIRYSKVTIDASVDADLAISLSLVVDLHPSTRYLSTGELEIALAPTVQLSGDVQSISNKQVNVSGMDFGLAHLLMGPMPHPLGDLLHKSKLGGILQHGLIDRLIGNGIASYMTPENANAVLGPWLMNKQAALNATIGRKTYLVPAVSATLANDMFGFVTRYPLRFAVSSEYLRANQPSVLTSLLIGSADDIVRQLGTRSVCEMSYQYLSTGGLLRQMPYNAAPPDFMQTTVTNYCDEVAIDPQVKIGNAAAWGASATYTQTPWTRTPGTQIDSGVLSIASNYQPYMKRVNYKTIDLMQTQWAGGGCWLQGGEGGDPFYWCDEPYSWEEKVGECRLEMRIYKRDVNASGLKPLIALHGGVWSQRGIPFAGLESQISHLTERGFVVFLPFYRLVGNDDGNAECHNVTGVEIQADLEDAYNWVQASKYNYGASGDLIVMGQSAGAHMAGMLAVNHPEAVTRALMMYPPTDAQDFIGRYNQTPRIIDSPDAVSALSGYFGRALETLTVNDPFVTTNSLPYRVSTNSLRSKFFLVHGNGDAMVPVRQSVRLCNSLYGTADLDAGNATSYGGNPVAGPYRVTYSCDNVGSRLDVIAGAGHALDHCIPGLLCPAGTNPGSVLAARQSFLDGLNWLAL